MASRKFHLSLQWAVSHRDVGGWIQRGRPVRPRFFPSMRSRGDNHEVQGRFPLTAGLRGFSEETEIHRSRLLLTLARVDAKSRTQPTVLETIATLGERIRCRMSPSNSTLTFCVFLPVATISGHWRHHGDRCISISVCSTPLMQ
jgi:hypothetical protein